LSNVIRRPITLLLIYTLLAICLTWPTAPQPATHLPGDGGDDPAIAWNLWWVKYALLNSGQNLFQTDFMFYPIGINLAFYTLTPLNAVTALPLTLNFGLVLASNLHLLFTFVVGGYGAFLLARYVLATTGWANSRGAGEQGVRGEISPLLPCPPAPLLHLTSAAIAGGIYAFASNKLFYVSLGQFNIASAHWIPFAVLYLLRTRHNPQRWQNPLMAGLFLTLQAWSELTYASFLLVFIALYWLWNIVISVLTIRHLCPVGYSPFTSLLLHLHAGLILLATFFLGLSPILAQMLPDLWAEGDFLVEGGGFANAFSADLLGFIIPTKLHPLLGQLITQTNIQTFDKGQHIYLGIVLLGLFLVGLAMSYRRAELRFWLVASLVFALLCLGPMITINGQATGLPGPFVLLQNLPFFKGNRYPSRYSVMLILSLSLIAALTVPHLAHWVSRKFPDASTFHLPSSTLLFLLTSLFLVEHLSAPLPQSDMRVPPAYQVIAADPGDFTVLDIPFAWRNGFRITGAETTQFMFGQFYQTYHQKRLLQGNTSRNPVFKFQYFTQAPVLNSLLALETGHNLPPNQQQADQPIAAEVLRFFNIRYIVVRPFRYAKFDGQQIITVTEQAVIPYIEQVFPIERIHAEPAITIYRVKNGAPPTNYQIDPTSPLAPLYFGEGWSSPMPGQPSAAQRQQVRLFLPLTGATQRIVLRLRPPNNAAPPQSLTLALKGWLSPPQALGQDWQEVTFDLPAGVAQPGLHELWLRFAQVTPLASVGPQSSTPSSLEVTVLSAGNEVGNFGHIYVDGHDISPNQRGYNVAIIQADGILHTANFDTHFNPAVSTQLARFLAAVPANALIAIAAADEASAKLTDQAVQALHTVGVETDLRGCFRCSHAFIRTPGGQIFEALDSLRPVVVTTGLGLTEPQLAAEIEWIRVEAVER
jgi:hypothetical protein